MSNESLARELVDLVIQYERLRGDSTINAKIKKIGQRLHDEGGLSAMKDVAQLVYNLGSIQSPVGGRLGSMISNMIVNSLIAQWDGIGDWANWKMEGFYEK